MAPEVLLGLKQKHEEFQTSATDIYSMGIIIHEMLTGEILKNPLNNYGKWNYNNVSYRLEKSLIVNKEMYIKKGISEELAVKIVELVNGCLKRNPTERLTTEEFANKLQGLLQK
jgi:serine/threonine protein kinase